jgi:hypothetical protein
VRLPFFRWLISIPANFEYHKCNRQAKHGETDFGIATLFQGISKFFIPEDLIIICSRPAANTTALVNLELSETELKKKKKKKKGICVPNTRVLVVETYISISLLPY